MKLGSGHLKGKIYKGSKFMKKIIFIIIILTLFSCNTFKLKDEIKVFLDDILQNPQKLKNLEKYYPTYYDSVLTNLFLNDTYERSRLINFITDTFSLDLDYEVHRNRCDVTNLMGYRNYKNYKKYFKDIIRIYSFFIVNSNDDYMIFYYAELSNNKYLLFDIWFYRNYSKSFYP